MAPANKKISALALSGLIVAILGLALNLLMLHPRASPTPTASDKFYRLCAAMSTPLDRPDQGGTATLDRELEELLREENLEPGDHERFSHYVPREKLTEAMVSA